MLNWTARFRFAAIVATAALFTWLAPASALAADAAAGKTAYTTNCASCHGDTGKGDGPVGAVLPPPSPRDFSAGDFKFDTDGTFVNLHTVDSTFNTMPSAAHKRY